MTRNSYPFIKSSGPWPVALAMSLSFLLGSLALYSLQQLQSTSESAIVDSIEAAPVVQSVGALGRIEPEGEVIRVSAPASQGMSRIEQLLVQEGDQVRQGQAIAILETQANRLAALEQARKQVRVAQARLAQVQAGAKTGDIEAQSATVSRLQAQLSGEIATREATITRIEHELANAEVEYQRYQKLHQEGAISTSELDSRQLRVETAQGNLAEARAALEQAIMTLQRQQKEAQAQLDSIAEVRPVDVQLAQTEVDSAIAAVKQAEADLALTYIRAPRDGQVLKIHTWPGELISNDGIIDLGKTNQMYVVAEVYQTDIQKVTVGQTAIITSPALSDQLQGVVAQVGLLVDQQDIFANNALTDTDRKVVNVKIRLDESSSQKVADLTNLQVQVVINR